MDFSSSADCGDEYLEEILKDVGVEGVSFIGRGDNGACTPEGILKECGIATDDPRPSSLLEVCEVDGAFDHSLWAGYWARHDDEMRLYLGDEKKSSARYRGKTQAV